ncbi:MAG: short-chain dehydrogenase/reductase, partial [Alphaproteobacteria bacterium]
VRAHALDLARSEDQRRLAAATGAVDILVNNAGAIPNGSIDELSEDVWRQAWELKLYGYVNLTRLYYAMMKERGHGVIVNNIGSAGERMYAGYIAGSAANSALIALTRALGSRSSEVGVRVVGVNPGLTATERAGTLLRSQSEQTYGTSERWRDVLKDMNLPFGRMAEPREVADLIAFLASPRAAYISGTTISVDGGATHRHI